MNHISWFNVLLFTTFFLELKWNLDKKMEMHWIMFVFKVFVMYICVFSILCGVCVAWYTFGGHMTYNFVCQSSSFILFETRFPVYYCLDQARWILSFQQFCFHLLLTEESRGNAFHGSWGFRLRYSCLDCKPLTN